MICRPDRRARRPAGRPAAKKNRRRHAKRRSQARAVQRRRDHGAVAGAEMPAAQHRRQRARGWRFEPGDRRRAGGPESIARRDAADFRGHRPSAIEHPVRRPHVVPVDVVGPRAADERRLDESPSDTARASSRARGSNSARSVRAGSAANQTARRGSACHSADQRQPFVPVAAPYGHARREDRRPPTRRRGARWRASRSMSTRSPPWRGRRHVVERAEDRRALARVVHRRRDRLHQRRSRRCRCAAAGSARAGRPSSGGDRGVGQHRQQRQRVARRHRLLEQQMEDRVGPNTASDRHEARAARARRCAARRRPPARRRRCRATSPTARRTYSAAHAPPRAPCDASRASRRREKSAPAWNVSA